MSYVSERFAAMNKAEAIMNNVITALTDFSALHGFEPYDPKLSVVLGVNCIKLTVACTPEHAFFLTTEFAQYLKDKNVYCPQMAVAFKASNP
jgi:hypothetical protein